MSTAQDIMATGVITLSVGQSLMEAFQTLQEHQITGAPVVNEESKLVGVLSQSDLLREAFSNEAFADFSPNSFYIGLPVFDGGALEGLMEKLDEMNVEEAMNHDVISVSPSDPVESLASKMRNHKVHRLIVAEDEKLVGIVTTFDLLKLLEMQ